MGVAGLSGWKTDLPEAGDVAGRIGLEMRASGMGGGLSGTL